MSTNHRILGAAAIALLTTAGAACADIFGSDDPSWFRASLSVGSSATQQYEGRGSFYVGPDAAAGVPVRFDVASSTQDGSQSFLLHRRGDGIPAVGRHPMGLVDQGDPTARGMTAFYARTSDTWVEYFVADSGFLDVTRASSGRVNATFQFEGFRYCAVERVGGEQTGPCVPPAEPIPDAPRVVVTGSFSVAAFDGKVDGLVGLMPMPDAPAP